MNSRKWESSQNGYPECGGNNLDLDSFDQVQFGEIYQEVSCLDCETSWTEVYRLSCITDVGTSGFVREDCAIYARVSTNEQSTEPQLLDLRRYADQRGWDVYQVYDDKGISGTRNSRPALDDLMNDARKRRFDVVLVWRFDRFARSTKHLVLALEEFKNLGIDFVSYQENIDTSSPLGAAIFTIIGAVAQLERDIIAERVKGGLRRAKSNGTKLGRPQLQPDADKARKMRSEGLSLRAIATGLGISHTKVAQLL